MLIDFRFKDSPEIKEEIYSHVRKGKYESLSDFVRKAIKRELEVIAEVKI